ncbi:hypothetical protein N431DRAFT_461242 [Stipitochalara longipes BDJ]|nr:hypothetical protein N431DRAFT_461242 [Stipitochalara longipes BDJ]
MEPSVSSAQEELQPTEPQTEDIQFRDDGHILINLSPNSASSKGSVLLPIFPSILGDPLFIVRIGGKPGKISKILEQADFSLSQQTQDIKEFIGTCSRYARKVLGRPAHPAGLRNVNEDAHTRLSLPSKNFESVESPAVTASGSTSKFRTTQRWWDSAKIIFPRGAVIDGAENFNYVLVCAQFDGKWQHVHLACSQDTSDGDLFEMLRLVPLDSSLLTNIRRMFSQIARYKSEISDYNDVYVPESLLQHRYYTKYHSRNRILLSRICQQTSLVTAIEADQSFTGHGLWIDNTRSKIKQALSLLILVMTMLFMFGVSYVVQRVLLRGGTPKLSIVQSCANVVQMALGLVFGVLVPGYSLCSWVRIYCTIVIELFELARASQPRLRASPGNSSPLPNGLKRAEWVNIQGKIIEDDYFELIPNAIQQLTSQLPTYQTTSSSFNTFRSARLVLLNIGREFFELSKSVARIISRGSKAQPSQPDVELDQSSNPKVPFGPDDSRSVLLCISSLRPSHHKTTMRSINIIDIEDDENLFRAFRNEYRKLIGMLRWWFSLRTIVVIRFIHFEVDHRALADIKHYSREDKLEVHAIPPETHHDYLYEPKPIELIPPLGHNTLLEFWHRPHNGTGRKACIMRIPTYRLDTVPLRHHDQLGEAWGLEVIEGRRWEIFWYIAALVFAGSFLFVIVWGVLHHNLSEAFSVASFLQTSFAIAVGLTTLSATVDFIS